jgi:hypothetical protein
MVFRWPKTNSTTCSNWLTDFSLYSTENGTDQTYAFSSSMTSGTVTTGFNIGGTNTLSLIVNNTGTWYGGPTHTWQTTTDGSNAGVTASLSYNGATTVPTLSTAALGALGGLLVLSAFLAMRTTLAH